MLLLLKLLQRHCLVSHQSLELVDFFSDFAHPGENLALQCTDALAHIPLRDGPRVPDLRSADRGLDGRRGVTGAEFILFQVESKSPFQNLVRLSGLGANLLQILELRDRVLRDV